MDNATDCMASVRDAANDLARELAAALALDADGEAALNSSLRMFAHSLLDAARCESAA